MLQHQQLQAVMCRRSAFFPRRHSHACRDGTSSGMHEHFRQGTLLQAHQPPQHEDDAGIVQELGMRQVASVGNLASEGREDSPLGASVPPKVGNPGRPWQHRVFPPGLELAAYAVTLPLTLGAAGPPGTCHSWSGACPQALLVLMVCHLTVPTACPIP